MENVCKEKMEMDALLYHPWRTELFFFQNSFHFQHCIYFSHRSFSLLQTWLLLQHGVLLQPTCLLGPESPQALGRIKSNAVLFLSWLELGQTEWLHCMLAPATPTISGFTAREMPQVTHQVRGRAPPSNPH